ncbi:MAG: phage tail sheath family protein [Deltaproteobacteria bacterium]|nr:phage tail sheath family protein [Deltaproteobacteria bacterium]
MSVYKHGVYVTQLPTSIVPPRRIGAAMPVVVGTAPVHMVREDFTGPVNDPFLAYTHGEAVTNLGYSEDWKAYTLCEFLYSQFVLFALAPVVFINVFDPAVHKTAVSGEAASFEAGKLTLAHPGLVAAPVVKSEDGLTTHVAGTDYEVDRITGEITLVEGGAIAADATVQVDYSYGDPSLVDADDIVGGIVAATGQKTGLELVDQVFPRFRLLPGLVLAPGWSHNPLVAAVMVTKAGNVNGHFSCFAYVDIPSDASGADRYSEVAAWKNLNNYVDPGQYNLWPKVKIEDKVFHLSTQAAGITGSVDADNEDIPYESPSNKALKANGAIVESGDTVFLGISEANYLNEQGVATPLNFIGGWKLWGNRTGCYPAVTDVKDAFLPIQRMFRWLANTFILTFWQKVDKPLNRRLVETIIDSFNIFLNGLAARQFILGGRVEFLRDENPITDLMDGIIRFHLYVTPPSPAREIHGLLEYDPGYVNTLFGGE